MPIDTTEGGPNCVSHDNSCGMRPSKITRFAGLEIGSTKLAALAMKAQTNR